VIYDDTYHRRTYEVVGWEPRGAWKLVVNAGHLARHPTAAPRDAAAFAGEPDQHQLKRSLLAEVRIFFKDNPTWE